ncbi:hypothetical protein EYF80_041956 [Liparis tanakae]|uniref:Uncharacterized protein n=1 Tax=Liparis tanakae TaxID=230148 RepID=A0A4Z2G5J1_9TELE|nr:hypothetical protein EYF80_041956 [Liparis tanakae]
MRHPAARYSKGVSRQGGFRIKRFRANALWIEFLPLVGPDRVKRSWTALTWSNQRLGAEGGDAAAHVYSSDLWDRRSVPLLPRFEWAVGGAGLPPREGLRHLAGTLDQGGGLDGHRALLQAESLQGLGLRAGRGRPLLATDGQVLDLILEERRQNDGSSNVDPLL